MTNEVLIILILSLFSALAFWKQNALMFFILFAVSFPLSLYIPDLISSTASTTGVDVAFALGVLMYALMCGSWFIKLMWGET